MEVPCQGSWILSQPFNDLTCQTLTFCCLLSINWQSQRPWDLWWSLYQLSSTALIFNCYEIVEFFQVSGSYKSSSVCFSCMNHHIHLFFKSGQSRADMLKTFKTVLLVWDFGVLLDWYLFMQITLTMLNVTLISNTFTSLTKLLALVQHQTN